MTLFLLFLSSGKFLHCQKTFYAGKHLASDWKLLYLDLYTIKINFGRVWCGRHSNLLNVSLLLLFLLMIIDPIEDLSAARIVLSQKFELLHWNKFLLFLYFFSFSSLVINASMMMLKQIKRRSWRWFRFRNELSWFR